MAWLELRIPPLAVVVIVASGQYCLARALPALRWSFDGSQGLAVVIALVGAAVCVSGVLAFRRAATTVDPTRPAAASSVVCTGIYRISRNPMYLGFALMLAGWALWLQNPASLLCVAAFVTYLTHFQIRPEERALERRFGTEYVRYRASVRRWL